MEFKKGDRVRIVFANTSNQKYIKLIGSIGVVYYHNGEDESSYRIDFGPSITDIYNDYFIWSDFEMKHARIRNTRTARKLNPDLKIEGKWLVYE